MKELISAEQAVHYGPDESKWVTPRDELEEIELGWRVTWFILTEKFCRLYSDVRSRFDISVFQPWGSKHSEDSPWFQGLAE